MRNWIIFIHLWDTLNSSMYFEHGRSREVFSRDFMYLFQQPRWSAWCSRKPQDRESPPSQGLIYAANVRREAEAWKYLDPSLAQITCTSQPVGFELNNQGNQSCISLIIIYVYIYMFYTYTYTYIILYTVLTSISHVQARPTCSQMLRSLKLGRTYRFRTDIRQISSSGMHWLQQLQHFATLMGAMRLAALENWRATESLGRIDFHSLVPGMTS